jgi:hypothetical protein
MGLLEGMIGCTVIVGGLLLALALISAVGWTAVALADETELTAAWDGFRARIAPRTRSLPPEQSADVIPATVLQGRGDEVITAGDSYGA